MRALTIRSAFAFALTVAAGAAWLPGTAIPEAQASVAFASNFDELIGGADLVLIAKPVESKSQWEGRRIVTLTRVQLEERVAGENQGEVWIKTLGGIVDNIGQSVAGEPSFPQNEKSLVFLKRLPDAAAYLVVQRAQGQYHVMVDAKTQSVTLEAGDVGMLLPARRLAQVGAPAVGAPAGGVGIAPLAARPATRFANTLARDVFTHRPVRDAVVDIKDAWLRMHPAKSP